MSSTVEKYYENNPEAENINPNTIRKNNDFETLYPELAEEFKKCESGLRGKKRAPKASGDKKESLQGQQTVE